MKLISTLTFLLLAMFTLAQQPGNHFEECLISQENGKYGIVINQQLAVPYEYDEILPQRNCFFKVKKDGKYGVISYFYQGNKKDFRSAPKGSCCIALKKGYACLYLSLSCEYERIEEFEGQYFQIVKNNKKGMLSHYGTLLLPCQFEKIEWSRDYLWVENNKRGI